MPKPTYDEDFETVGETLQNMSNIMQSNRHTEDPMKGGAFAYIELQLRELAAPVHRLQKRCAKAFDAHTRELRAARQKAESTTETP